MSPSPSHVPYALMVDLDLQLRRRSCEILEDAGFRTFDVETADEAILLLKTSYEAVVLIFTGVEMPGQRNGFALAREAAVRWPHISTVVVSDRYNPGPGDLPKSTTFICKSFNAQTVRDEINRLLPEGRKPEPLKRMA